MNEILQQTRQKIFNIYYDLEKLFESKSQNELEQIRHKADEIKQNRNRDWTERTAAEMIYTAASQKLNL